MTKWIKIHVLCSPPSYICNVHFSTNSAVFVVKWFAYAMFLMFCTFCIISLFFSYSIFIYIHHTFCLTNTQTHMRSDKRTMKLGNTTILSQFCPGTQTLIFNFLILVCTLDEQIICFYLEVFYGWSLFGICVLLYTLFSPFFLLCFS